MSNATEKEVGRLQVQGHDILIVQVDFPGEPALWDLYSDADVCLTEDSSLDHYPTVEDAERLLEERRDTLFQGYLAMDMPYHEEET